MTAYAQIKSGFYDEIQNRHSERIEAERKVASLKPPCMLSAESVKKFNDTIKMNQLKFLDASLLETRDMKILIATLNQIQIDFPEIPVAEFIREAWESNPLDAVKAAIVAAKAEEQEVQDEKNAKKAGKGEVDGQLKLFKDDGSTAEGGAVSTQKVDPDKIDETLAAKDERQLPVLANQPGTELSTEIVEAVVTDVTEQVEKRELLHGIFSHKEYNNLIDMYKSGRETEARQYINDSIVERTPKKGRNALFKQIDSDLAHLIPSDAKAEKAAKPKVDEPMTALEKKAAAKAAKKTGKAK